MSRVLTAQDIAATFGGFASDAAYSVAEASAEWFASRRDAAAMVERYTTAAVWCFAQGSADFLKLENPDPTAAMKAYQAGRLARFIGVAPNQGDQAVWRMLQEDAETFATILMDPLTQSSANPLDRIADGWFRERAGRPASELIPPLSAARLASTTGQLYGGMTELLAKVAGG